MLSIPKNTLTMHFKMTTMQKIEISLCTLMEFDAILEIIN